MIIEVGTGIGKVKTIDTKTVETNFKFIWNLRKETVVIFTELAELYNKKRGKFVLTIAHDPTGFDYYVAGLWVRRYHGDLSSFWRMTEKVTEYEGKQRIPRKLKKQYRKEYPNIMECPYMSLSKKIELINTIKHYSKEWVSL